MFKLISAIISLILILPILVCGVVVAGVYFLYIRVQPAEYTFIAETSEIESIEYASFVFSESGLLPNKAGVITDVEGFTSDLKTIECYTGISGAAFQAIKNGDAIDGVIINYKDGNWEFITPYICVNSDSNPKTIYEVLGMRVYGFNNAQFHELLVKYGVVIDNDILDHLKNPLGALPDAVTAY